MDAAQLLAEQCDLAGLPPFDFIQVAPLLRPGAPREAADALASAALEMVADGTYKAIMDRWWGPTPFPCAAADQASVSVSWEQVSRVPSSAAVAVLLLTRR